jgi:hypothetical protein
VDRTAIVGCGGSGKSQLARSLGRVLGITPVHLDGLYYDAGWKPLDQEKFADLQRELVTGSRWIIDGNYASSLPIRLQSADTVIFFDLPAGSACGASCSAGSGTAAVSIRRSACITRSPGISSATSSATGERWLPGYGP